MKKNIYMIFLVLLVMTGCSGGSSEDETTNEEVDTSVVLNVGDTLVCSNSTQFTVTPTNDPVIVFTTDTFTGDTSIEVTSESALSSVLVENCTEI